MTTVMTIIIINNNTNNNVTYGAVNALYHAMSRSNKREMLSVSSWRYTWMCLLTIDNVAGQDHYPGRLPPELHAANPPSYNPSLQGRILLVGPGAKLRMDHLTKKY